jgi:hypothetical protein
MSSNKGDRLSSLLLQLGILVRRSGELMSSEKRSQQRLEDAFRKRTERGLASELAETVIQPEEPSPMQIKMNQSPVWHSRYCRPHDGQLHAEVQLEGRATDVTGALSQLFPLSSPSQGSQRTGEGGREKDYEGFGPTEGSFGA